jgi:hypothetical protein
VFEVRLASGRTIRCTAKHRLYGATGWKRVEQLAVGDRLAIARRLREPATTERWSDARVALLGQMIGDGSYLNNAPMRYTTESEANAEAVRAGAVELGCKVTRYAGRNKWFQLMISGNGNRWHPAGVNRWFSRPRHLRPTRIRSASRGGVSSATIRSRCSCSTWGRLTAVWTDRKAPRVESSTPPTQQNARSTSNVPPGSDRGAQTDRKPGTKPDATSRHLRRRATQGILGTVGMWWTANQYGSALAEISNGEELI